MQDVQLHFLDILWVCKMPILHTLPQCHECFTDDGFIRLKIANGALKMVNVISALRASQRLKGAYVTVGPLEFAGRQ